MAVEKNTQGTLKSVEKVLRLLRCFSIETPEQSIGELVAKLGMPKVSVYRFLRVLIQQSFISQDPHTKNYRLGFRMFELGSVVLRNFSLREAAFPIMSALAQRCRERVHLGVLDKYQAVSIEGIEGSQSLRPSIPLGKRVYLHSTGVGKAILAFLPGEKIQEIVREVGLPVCTANTIVDVESLGREIALVRSRGYAIDNEENEAEIRCIAAPLFDSRRKVVGSISISGPSSSIRPETIPELTGMVLEASSKISKALGYSPSSTRMLEYLARRRPAKTADHHPPTY